MADHSSIRHCLALAPWKTAMIAPAPTIFALACGKHCELLHAALGDAAQLNPAGHEELDVSAINVHLRRIADRPVALITLPPPFKCPEPRIIALVLDKQVRGPIRKSDLEGGTIEFFTLEEPPPGLEHPPTMLCCRDALLRTSTHFVVGSNRCTSKRHSGESGNLKSRASSNPGRRTSAGAAGRSPPAFRRAAAASP